MNSNAPASLMKEQPLPHPTARHHVTRPLFAETLLRTVCDVHTDRRPQFHKMMS